MCQVPKTDVCTHTQHTHTHTHTHTYSNLKMCPLVGRLTNIKMVLRGKYQLIPPVASNQNSDSNWFRKKKKIIYVFM